MHSVIARLVNASVLRTSSDSDAMRARRISLILALRTAASRATATQADLSISRAPMTRDCAIVIQALSATSAISAMSTFSISLTASDANRANATVKALETFNATRRREFVSVC